LSPPAGEAPSIQCWASAVSADGSVFGQCIASSGRQAFRYNGTMTFLSLTPFPASHHTSIIANVSRDGTIIVGTVNNGERYYTPFYRNASGSTFLPLASSSSFEAFPEAVSNNGSTIAGYDIAGNGPQAWRWTAAGGTVLLPELAGHFAHQAADISIDGNTSIGSAQDSNGAWRILRWIGNAAPANLGAGLARAMNGSGTVIVGCTTLDAGPAKTAIVWSANSVRTLGAVLGNPSDMTGWTELCLNDVSDDGKWVVGIGQHSGRQEGFIAHLP
jgi:uncharacterized membrane protein